MSKAFRVGLTRDFLKPDGTVGFGDIGLSVLDAAEGIEWEFLAENASHLTAEQVKPYDGLLVLAPCVTADTLKNNQRLKVIARFGVGYDNIDVPACTRCGIALTITPDGVRRPVAVSALTLLLALSHKVVAKDKLTRAGRWDDKLDYMGQGVTGRTLGIIGLGNIGREILRLAAPFQMRHIGYDPHVDPQLLTGLNVEVVTLDELLGAADFVVICCALVPDTHHLISAKRIGLLKSTAYLINVARGPIVDQCALTDALREKRIQGAALDVFEQEPIDPQDPLLALDNVLLTPHAICWTDELFLSNGREASQSIVDVAAGRVPKHLVNPEVIGSPQSRVE